MHDVRAERCGSPFRAIFRLDPLKRFAYLIAALTLMLATTAPIPAHEPSAHGFHLTMFAPPFAAPNFQLTNLSGDAVNLTDYRGEYVLLNFWATWCPPCLAEMPSMQSAFERYRDRGFVVLAVSSDVEGKTIVQPFTDKLGVSFPVLLDTEGRVSEIYGAVNLPLSFLLNRNGEVIAGAQGARDWYSEEAISVLDEMMQQP